MKKKEKEGRKTIEDLADVLTNLVFPACLSLKKDTFADRIGIVCGNLDAILRFHQERGKPITTSIKIEFSDKGDRYHLLLTIKVKSENGVVLSYQEFCVFCKSESLLNKWAKEVIEQVDTLKEKYGDVDTDDDEEEYDDEEEETDE